MKYDKKKPCGHIYLNPSIIHSQAVHLKEEKELF